MGTKQTPEQSASKKAYRAAIKAETFTPHQEALIEWIAEAFYRDLKLDPRESFSPFALARKWLGPETIVQAPSLPGAQATTSVRDRRIFIGVNQRYPLSFQRFCVGHELGHVILDSRLLHRGHPPWLRRTSAKCFAYFDELGIPGLLYERPRQLWEDSGDSPTVLARAMNWNRLERACDRLGAALCCPLSAMRRALRALGPDADAFSDLCGLSRAWARKRIAEASRVRSKELPRWLDGLEERRRALRERDEPIIDQFQQRENGRLGTQKEVAA